MKNQKSVKVLDRPPTYILVDEDRNEAEVIAKWRRKYAIGKTELSEEQKRREFETVRGGKVLQRSKYK